MAITINGSGTITGVSAGGLPDGVVTADDLASTLDLTGKTVTLPAGTGGKVLQVVQTVKSDTFSTTSTSFTDITGYSVSITPSSSSSKVLVLVNLNATVETEGAYAKLLRGSTDIYIGDSNGSLIRSSLASLRIPGGDGIAQGSMVYLDSPNTTSSTTYKVQIRLRTGSGTLRVNLNNDGSTVDSTKSVASSSITVMEIAA